jgi:adenylylsulfate kinase-like enzyme
LVAIVAFISPYRADRRRAREIVQGNGAGIPLYEVFLDVPLEVCEQRDPKHLYAKARAGEIREFTGISAPYERAESPDLVLRTDLVSVEEAVATLSEYLLPRLQPARSEPPTS